MNISSILITLVGIIIIIALYVVSRLGQSNLPNKETSLLPDIKDENGDAFTSILDDIPASDGSTPQVIPRAERKSPEKVTSDKQQVVLFVSSKEEQELDGDLIKKALLKHGLILGDKNIYHYLIENNNDNEIKKSASLFRVANGMEPWTLTDNDLVSKKLHGLSIVMLLPNVIDNKTAIATFIKTADAIAVDIDGVLKNQQQEILSAEERASILGE